MTRKPFYKPELLAPAGDLLRCKTAILYGADAVYIGGQKYSLRSRASNFAREDIAEACSFARAHGAEIHVTVNEIPHEEDFDGLEAYLQFLEQAGVKAIIAASPAVMRLCRKTAPGLEVHCSTQMSTVNSTAVQQMIEMTDCDRVVLGRDCTLEEVQAITASCSREIEVFIHGGMCVNYSGRCTLSNRMTRRDANRGGCAQSCRWHYDVLEDGNRISSDDTLFTMGSKDMMAMPVLEDLMQMGVASLKIEGRMKTEYYVASVVSAYRHLIDEIAETGGALSPERLAYHRKEVSAAENRCTWPGNYGGVGTESSVIYRAHSNDNVNHAFLGTVRSCRDGMLELETRNPIDRYEHIEVLEPGRPNRSFVLEELQDEDGNPIEKSRIPMRIVRMKVPFAAAPGALLRKETE